MAIDDEFEKQDLARELANGAQKTAEEIIVHSQIVGLISWFLPPSLLAVGAAVNAGFTQLANKRFYARLEEMRNGMHARLQEVGESKVDKDWFQSEEFQTMLFEAARQVQQLPTGRRLLCLGTRWQTAVSRGSARKAGKSCSCRSSVISHLSTLQCCGGSCLTIRCQLKSDGGRAPHLPKRTKIWRGGKCYP